MHTAWPIVAPILRRALILRYENLSGAKIIDETLQTEYARKLYNETIYQTCMNQFAQPRNPCTEEN